MKNLNDMPNDILFKMLCDAFEEKSAEKIDQVMNFVKQLKECFKTAQEPELTKIKEILNYCNKDKEPGITVLGMLCRFMGRQTDSSLDNILMKLANLLVEAGAYVDLPDFYGITPLFYATQKGSICMIKFLLQKGANPLNLDSWLLALNVNSLLMLFKQISESMQKNLISCMMQICQERSKIDTEDLASTAFQQVSYVLSKALSASHPIHIVFPAFVVLEKLKMFQRACVALQQANTEQCVKAKLKAIIELHEALIILQPQIPDSMKIIANDRILEQTILLMDPFLLEYYIMEASGELRKNIILRVIEKCQKQAVLTISQLVLETILQIRGTQIGVTQTLDEKCFSDSILEILNGISGALQLITNGLSLELSSTQQILDILNPIFFVLQSKMNSLKLRSSVLSPALKGLHLSEHLRLDTDFLGQMSSAIQQIEGILEKTVADMNKVWDILQPISPNALKPLSDVDFTRAVCNLKQALKNLKKAPKEQQLDAIYQVFGILKEILGVSQYKMPRRPQAKRPRLELGHLI